MTMAAEGPVIPSYTEAYLMGDKLGPGYAASRASTERYASPAFGHRASKVKNFVDGTAVPAKPISVLHRPIKPSSRKNAENLDAQFQKDNEAFERRAGAYRRLAENKYHHNAPPGSILTVFEQGHIVDRGRGKSDVHEARGVYDPVMHTYRVQPSNATAAEVQRPLSAPHVRRSYSQIYAEQQQQLQQQGQGQGQQPARPVSPCLEGKRLQAARGTYNPLTHEYRVAPEPEYAARKQKEWERMHGVTGSGMRHIQPRSDGIDPISGEPKPQLTHSVSPGPVGDAPVLLPSGAVAPTTPGAPALADDAGGSTPNSAPPQWNRQHGSGRQSIRQGESWGVYDPICHEWKVPPRDARYMQQESLVERASGVSGVSAGRTAMPARQGVYNPILNSWTVPPADMRVAAGLSFAPATLFSRPTAATIRM